MLRLLLYASLTLIVDSLLDFAVGIRWRILILLGAIYLRDDTGKEIRIACEEPPKRNRVGSKTERTKIRPLQPAEAFNRQIRARELSEEIRDLVL